MSAKVLSFIFLFATLTGCSARESYGSRLTHTWGDTVRGSAPAGKAAACAESSDATFEVSRLNALLKRIADANPETFHGPLAPETFCLLVDNSITKKDARTQPEVKKIIFSRPLLAAAETDDELAAVLSHELAHVSLQHQGMGEWPPRMSTDSVFIELKRSAEAVQLEIATLAKQGSPQDLILTLAEKFGAIQKDINSRIDEVYGERNAHVSWIEQEADEVGAEFFVKAGFERDAFASILWKTIESTAEERTLCENTIVQVLNGLPAQRPERGPKSHPNVCWRVFHLRVDEWHVSHADY
jgi:hypothetical protein